MRSVRIDTLRGIAVFGILVVNVWGVVYGFAALRYGVMTAPAPVQDKLAVFLVAAFAEQKFYPIFAFLFGAGFALQMRALRAAGGGIDAAKVVYRRRLMWLLGCGLVHGIVIWFGDILTAYALTGFLLLLVAGKRVVAVIGMLRLILFVNAVVLLVLAFAAAALASMGIDAMMESVDEALRAHAVYTQGSWRDIAGARLDDFGANVGSYPFFLPRVALLFLFGVIAVRLGWLTRPARHRLFWRKVLAVGLVLGVPLNVWWGYVALHRSMSPYFPIEGAALVSFLMDVGGACLGAAYVAALMLAGERKAGLLARWFAPVGRMALTNYLMQSVLLVFLLQGAWLGLGASLSRAMLLVLCGAIMLFQVRFSRWWLARHAQGPMEALWRRYTYKGEAIEQRRVD